MSGGASNVVRHTGIVALAVVATLLLVLFAPRASAADPAQMARTCPKGFVASKGRCVCPKGFVKRRSRCVCPKGFVKSKARCVCPKTKVRRGVKCIPRPVAGTTPITPGGTTGGTGATDGPPFGPPTAALVGQAAAEKILPYLVNATFTDCVAGWPNCAGSLEHRYGFFDTGVFYYCRLTATSGSDIINAPAPFQVIGAEQAVTGEWRVTIRVSSYGSTSHYTWDVRPDGSVTGLYWAPGLDPSINAPSSDISGLTWVRGGRDCSY